eukprot:9503827-Pyramimonas_sp.AAC.1
MLPAFERAAPRGLRFLGTELKPKIDGYHGLHLQDVRDDHAKSRALQARPLPTERRDARGWAPMVWRGVGVLPAGPPPHCLLLLRRLAAAAGCRGRLLRLQLLLLLQRRLPLLRRGRRPAAHQQAAILILLPLLVDEELELAESGHGYVVALRDPGFDLHLELVGDRLTHRLLPSFALGDEAIHHPPDQ